MAAAASAELASCGTKQQVGEAKARPASTKRPIRNFERMMIEVAAKCGYRHESLSHGYIHIFAKDGVATPVAIVHGRTFPLNGLSCSRVASDKAATSTLLSHFSVPHVPHFLSNHPATKYAGFNARMREATGELPRIMDALRQHGKLVLKPKDGSRGRNTFKVCNQLELERAWIMLLQNSRDFVYSPFLEIEHEFRCIMLDGDMRICFRKTPPTICGDGTSQVKALIAAYEADVKHAVVVSPAVRPLLDTILPLGERLVLDWTHNLSRGSRAELDVPDDLKTQLRDISNQAMSALGMRFASVDVVRLKQGGELTNVDVPSSRLMVMEVNSSVSVDGFLTQNPAQRDIACQMYADALSAFVDGNVAPRSSE